MKKRVYPLALLQPFLAAATILALTSFVLKGAPKMLPLFMQFVGVGSATGYVLLERNRRWIESGEQERDEISQSWDIFDQAKEQFKSECEQQLEKIANWSKEQNAEIAEEYQKLHADIAAAYEKFEAEKQDFQAFAHSEELRIRKFGDEINARRATLEIELQKRESDFEAGIQERREALGEKEYQLATLELGLSERRQTLELDFVQKVAEAKQRFLDQRSGLLEEIKHAQERLEVDREILEKDYNTKSLELQAAWSEFQNEQITWKQQQQDYLAKLEETANLAMQEDIALLEEEWAAREGDLQALIESYETKIYELELDLEQERGFTTAPAHKGYAGWVANKVLETIREFGLAIDYFDCQEFANSTREQPVVAVWLKRGEKTKPESIANLKKTIEIEAGIGECKLTIDPRGYVVVAFGAVDDAAINRTLPALPAAKENGDKPQSEQGSQQQVIVGKVEEPTQSQKHEAFNSSMFAVFGGTGTGKSTFVNNLLSYNAAHFGENVEIVINDMKYPDPDAQWRILGRDVVPSYHDYQDGECFEGLEDMLGFFMARSRRRKQDVRQKRPITRFKKAIWVVDEVPTLVTDSLKSAKLIKGSVRLVRGLDGRVCIVGQTPRCSDYGMKIPDMSNFTRFYLGVDFAILGLRETNISPRRKRQLTEDIYARQELIDQQVKEMNLPEGARVPASYFALVVTQSGNAFLMSLPAPGEYDSLASVKESEEFAVTSQSELPPISPQDIESCLNQIKDEGGGEPAIPQPGQQNNKVTMATVLSDQLQALTPLQRAIVLHAQSRAGEWLTYSSMISNDRGVRSSQNGKGIKAQDVKDACWSLVNNHKLGTLDENGKKFMMPAS